MSTFDAQRQKAFDFCADATKQLITLATGIVTITITFAKDFVTGVDDSAKLWAYFAWFVYLFSIIAGMITLLSLTAELEPGKTQSTVPTIRGAAATYSKFQTISFAIAILFTIIFGITAVSNAGKKNTDMAGKVSKIDTMFVKLDTIDIRGKGKASAPIVK